jgi:hypothetical protein
VCSAGCNTDWDPGDEPIKTPEKLWIDLEHETRRRALRLLADLCYAYITTAGDDSTLDDNRSEFDTDEREQAQIV